MSEQSTGDVLNALARFYKVDGDYMRCLACKRPQQVMWCHSAFPHGHGCKNEERAPGHPWLVMGNAITTARSSLPAAARLAMQEHQT